MTACIHQSFVHTCSPYGHDRTNKVKIEVDTVMTTTDQFKNMAVGQKDCLHHGGKNLDVFATYSEADCFLECSWKVKIHF